MRFKESCSSQSAIGEVSPGQIGFATIQAFQVLSSQTGIGYRSIFEIEMAQRHTL